MKKTPQTPQEGTSSPDLPVDADGAPPAPPPAENGEQPKDGPPPGVPLPQNFSKSRSVDINPSPSSPSPKPKRRGRPPKRKPKEVIKSMKTRAEWIMDVIRRYRRCQADFRSFVRGAWPTVYPTRKLGWNWHIDLICNALQSVAEGETKRLIINLPYRAMKSTLVSVMFPVWCWIRDPSKCFLTGSHGEDLAIRDAVASRRLIRSPWFQYAWGRTVIMNPYQDVKTRQETIVGGARLVFGMKSDISGEGGDILGIDDPHDAKKAMYSDLEREAVLNSYKQGWSTRLNDPMRSAIILIHQRVHPMDLTGYAVEAWTKAGVPFVHIKIPFEFDPDDRLVTPFGEDPRKEKGEFYWKDRFGAEFLAEAKENLGTYGVACQLNQAPISKEGGILRLDWFQVYRETPGALLEGGTLDRVVQFWDTAVKGKEIENCPWVCGTWGQRGPDVYLLHVHRDWHNYPEGRVKVVALADYWKPFGVVIEDASSGQTLLQELPGMAPGHAFLPFSPCGGGDKDMRLATESVAVEAGKVFLPAEAPWKETFLRELMEGVSGKYKDQRDMFSMALQWFREHPLGRGGSSALAVDTEGWGEEEDGGMYGGGYNEEEGEGW